MKLWLKVILKTVGGGFGSVFLYLCWHILKDVLYYVIQGEPCEDLIFVPVKIILGLFFVPSWNNWEFLFFIFGVLFILIIQFRPLLNVVTQKHAKQLFLILQITLLLITGLGINLEVQNELAIERTYSEFCRAAKDGNYALAYSYFSPQYRKKTEVNGFVKEIIVVASSSYVEGCDGEFVGTISHRLNGASLYPFRWTNSDCSLLELLHKS